MKVDLQIQRGSTGMSPAVLDNVTLTQERKAPSKLEVSVYQDEKLSVQEGDPIKLIIDDKPVFYGYVFTITRDGKSQKVKLTAYDQMRYLKNKDTYNFKDTTASGIISMVAADYGLSVGSIAGTSYYIRSLIEDNKTLIDIMQDALGIDMTNTKQLYILYDDVGKLTLKNAANMRLGLLIDADTAQTYDYESTIDDETYNSVKLVYEDSETKERQVFTASGGNRQWGTLQYFEMISEDDAKNGQAKANMLLSLYNRKTKNLTIQDAIGDTRVRGGSVIMVRFRLDENTELNNYMMVNSVKHTFKQNLHTMTLKMQGGEFIV